MEDAREKCLTIRADAGVEMGTGHLMRCLALAQAWGDAGGHVVLVTACRNEALLQRFRAEGAAIQLLEHAYPDPGDWPSTSQVLAAHPAACIVLDGYHLDETYQQRVKETGHHLLVIDDMAHLKHYYADIVLNQNLHADHLQYPCEPDTRLLLGTCYVLLRREFLAWKGWKRNIPQVARRVLVTLGGGDPQNHTLKVVQALRTADVPDLEATVVIGADNPHADSLAAAAGRASVPISLIRDAENMPELMAWADLAVASAGTTTWELLFLGTPILALVLADNQQALADELEQHGAGMNTGRASDATASSLSQAIAALANDAARRARMSQTGRGIVDGQGAGRLVTIMRDRSHSMVKLRPVRQQDCRMLWEWANDPAARAASFSPEAISWQGHVEWFEARLSDPNCYHYVLQNQQGVPVGQVRFDVSRDEAEVSVSIAPEFRGRAFGAAGISIASSHLFREAGIGRICAHIKPDNESSILAFTKAGYHADGTRTVKGHRALRMVLEKHEEACRSAPHQHR